MTRTNQRALANWPNNTVSVLDFGAVGDGVTDDTAAIQAAINSGNSLCFAKGTYAVTSITFNKDKTSYSFEGSYIKGIATVATGAVVNFDTIRHCTFNDLRVDQNFNLNYTAAIHWYCSDVGTRTPSEYVTVNGCRVNNATIGLLYGQLIGSTDAPTYFSENNVNDFISRGTETPVYVNQPNGYLYLNNPIIDSNRNEWPAGDLPNFTTDSRCLKIYYGCVQINGGQLTKTQTQDGALVDCAGELQITGSYLEIGCNGLVLDNETSTGYPQKCSVGISNVKCNLLNNRTMFELVAGTSGDLRVSGSYFQRSALTTNSAIPLIDTNNVTDWVVSLSNTYFPNYLYSNYMSAYKLSGPTNTWDLTFLASTCRLGSDNFGWVEPNTSVVSGSNSNGDFTILPDGTKYCWVKSLPQVIDIDIATDSGFRSSAGDVTSSWTLPVEFNDTGTIVVTGTVEGNDDIRIQYGLVNSSTEIRVQYHSNQSYTAKSLNVNLVAIGK